MRRDNSSAPIGSRRAWTIRTPAFDGRQTFLPAELIGSSGSAIESITFTHPSSFSITQNEAALYVSDEWTPFQRLVLNFGLRTDTDSVTGATHPSPRAGMILSLTNDGKTLLKAGAGIFYDRVPLMLPVFESFPDRTVSLLDTGGQVSGSTAYVNRIIGELQNPRSTAWNVELDRRVTENFTLRVGYEQRNTARDFVVSPTSGLKGITSTFPTEAVTPIASSKLPGGTRIPASRSTVRMCTPGPTAI